MSLWIDAMATMALVIFVFVIHDAVRSLQTTVQRHATLANLVLETAVLPGRAAAFTDRWHTATQGTAPTPQLWLTLHITNMGIGQSQVWSIAADSVLTPTISAIYPGTTTSLGTLAVLAERLDQTQARFTFLGLAPRNTHQAFITLRPDGIAGPPYKAQAQRQWMAQHRANWEQFTVTAEEQTTFVSYGCVTVRPPGVCRSQHACGNTAEHYATHAIMV